MPVMANNSLILPLTGSPGSSSGAGRDSFILPLNTGASKEVKIQPKQRSTSVADRIPSDSRAPDSLEGNRSLSCLSFPEDRGKYYMSFQISKYARKEEKTNVEAVRQFFPSLAEQGFVNFMKFNIVAEAMICLPMPIQMTDSLETDYAQENLGEIVPFLAGGREGSVSAETVDQQGYAEVLLSALNRIGTRNVVGDVLVKEALLAKLAATGSAINKYLTVLPKGPVYKRHNFSWRLSPRNARESRVLRKIIATFSKEMSMEVSEEQLIFKAPKIFQIEFHPDTKFLYYFKPAVLQQFKVNYAGNQGNVPAFYRDTGAPETVEIEMIFTELEFWSPKDYDAILNA